MAGHTIMTSSTLNKHIVEPQPLRATESTSSQMKSQTHVLIAEPNPVLRSVYSMWLRSRGFKNILVTDSGSKCIEEFDRIRNINQLPNPIVILDSHLREISFIELAKQIINKRPDQILIFSTLHSNIINSISINISSNIKTLLKPFKLSKLLQLIGNSS
jgi:DNA-binding NtrC family response regulator